MTTRCEFERDTQLLPLPTAGGIDLGGNRCVATSLEYSCTKWDRGAAFFRN